MLESLKAANLKRFNEMKVTLNFKTWASKLIAKKAVYQRAEKLSGVPWPLIAVIHMRESSQNFNTQLAQGDPLASISIHVPRGQGPYFGATAWERAAARALIETGGKTWGDWSPGGWTTYLEKYNGLGYANRGRPSPYVWEGTDQYRSGKYVADGVFSSTAVDTQPGCVSAIMAMAKQDTTINPQNLTLTVTPPIAVPVDTTQPTKEPTMLNWKTTAAGVAALIAAIGGLFTAGGAIDWTHLSTVLPAILAAIGLIFAKDSTTHSTPAEVTHAGVVADLTAPK